MDIKIIFASFALVFIAELGDKTQLTALAFASSSRSPWAVFIGTSLALVSAAALAVIFGEALARVLPPRVLRIGAAALFVLIGLVLLVNEARKGGVEEEATGMVVPATGPVGSLVLQQIRTFENQLSAEAREEAEASTDDVLRKALLRIAEAHESHGLSMDAMDERLDQESQEPTPAQRANLDAQLAAVGNAVGDGDEPVHRLIHRQEAAAEFYIALARMTAFHDARDTLRRLAMEEIDLAQELCTLTNHPDQPVS